MKDFYSIDENFKYLYNDVHSLLTEGIINPTVAENWLANWYVCNKYNTTKAVELYAADLIIPKLKDSEIPYDVFKSVINTRLNGCYESYNDNEITLEDKLYMVKNIKNSKINESTFSYIIQDFECDEIVSYIEESVNDNNFNPIQLIGSTEVYNIISQIKHKVVDNRNDQQVLSNIKECNSRLLYEFKDIAFEEFSYMKTSNLHEQLGVALINEDDAIIEHVIHELNHINSLIDYLINYKLNESSEEFIYNNAIDEFNNLVETIFFNESDDDIDLEQFTKLYLLTEAICEYESTLEASSRIITKGTEKVARSIGNKSAKSSGLSSSSSKVDQIKRGAKVVDDRASGAINTKIDQILNFTQDAKREKIITGKTTVKLGKALKSLIGLIIAGATVKSLPKTTIVKFGKFGLKANLAGLAVTIIGILGARAISKNVEVREKRRILLELETELKITKEKIEDAKGDNAREQKYQLMRIESQLEKEIFRIKHGMKPY